MRLHFPFKFLKCLRMHTNTKFYATEATRVNCNVGTIGHIDHGKTTLTAALTKVCSLDGNAVYVSYEQIDQAPEEKSRGITINIAHVGYKTIKRQYSHTDCPGHSDFIKNMIIGASQMDGVILVVAATDGEMPQTREHILVAKQIGLDKFIVFINKADIVDKDVLELVEMEVRDLLQKYGVDENTTPVICGSALLALQGDKSEFGEPSVRKLLQAMDEHIPIPQRDIFSPFYMPVDNLLTVPGRGTVAVGTLKRGTLKKRDNAVLAGWGNEIKTSVADIHIFHKSVEKTSAGDNVGLLLRGVRLKETRRGMVLCAPKSVPLRNHFEGELYLMTKMEGGLGKPLYNKTITTLLCDTWFVMARVDLFEKDMLMPGEHGKVRLIFRFTMPVLVGSRFTCREKGVQNIAAGIFTNVRNNVLEFPNVRSALLKLEMKDEADLQARIKN